MQKRSIFESEQASDLDFRSSNTDLFYNALPPQKYHSPIKGQRSTYSTGDELKSFDNNANNLHNVTHKTENFGYLETGTFPDNNLTTHHLQSERYSIEKRQIIQEYMNNEYKEQAAIFKQNFMDMINQSVKEIKEKNLRNRETVKAIKDSINQNRSNLLELNKKISDYYSSLDAVSSLLNSEILKIKEHIKNNGDKIKQSQQEKKIQNNSDREIKNSTGQMDQAIKNLKSDIEKILNQALDESNSTHDEDKIQKLLSEVAGNMRLKIEKVLDHLNGKVVVLEKQVQNYSKYDDPIVEKLKFEIEDKLNDHEQFLENERGIIFENLNNKLSEEELAAFFKKNQSDFKFSSLQDVLVDIQEEINSTSSFMNDTKIRIDHVLSAGHIKLKEDIKKSEYLAKSNPDNEITAEYDEDTERRIIFIENEFNYFKKGQDEVERRMNLQERDIASLKQRLKEDKYDAFDSDQLTLGRLDDILDQLSDKIENLKLSSGFNDDLTAIKFSKENSPKKNYEIGNLATFNPTLSSSPSEVAENKFNYNIHSSEKDINRGLMSYERFSPGKDFTLTASSVRNEIDRVPYYSLNPYDQIQIQQYPSHENSPTKIIGSPHSKRESVDTMNQVSANKEFKKNNIGIGSGFLKKDSKLENVENEESVEVLYQIDEDRYLMDEYGNYILDEEGNRLQLSEEKIEELKGMIVEYN